MENEIYKEMTVYDLAQLLMPAISRLQDRMDRLEGRMDRLEERMDRIEGRMDRIEGRLDRLEERTGCIESAMATKDDLKASEIRTNRKIEKLYIQANKRIDLISEKLS